MLNNAIMESLVSLCTILSLWRKNIQAFECGTVNLLEFRPSHELIRNETLEEFPAKLSLVLIPSHYKDSLEERDFGHLGIRVNAMDKV